MQRIRNLAEFENAVHLLCKVEPRFLPIIDQHGIPSLRVSPQGLEGLLMIVTEQFLSLKAAAAIWARVKPRLGACDAQSILSCKAEELLALGLSNAKVKTFHAAAKQVLDGALDFAALENLSENEIVKHLCALPGVGPWTADIFLLSVLGAADAWPVGDLALRVAVQDFLKLQQRPEISEMTSLAEKWRPHRAVAARLLWSHYRGLKGLAQAK